MRSDNTPYEFGLGFCVKLAKPDLLAGAALKAVKESGPERRLRWFTTDADVVMHGGEMLVHTRADTRVSVRSAGYGHTIGLTTFSASLPADVQASDEFEVEVMNQRYPATMLTKPLYDPTGERVRV
jgi:glycine cleavage system aminomethyltransferase T